MNDVIFCNGFSFNIFNFSNYHFTDLSKTPVPRHYFGCLTKGHAVIRSGQLELHLRPKEIFYIPKGLCYQSQWFGDADQKIEFYSFGFDIAPTRHSYILQKIPSSPKADLLFAELCQEIPFTEKGIGKLYRFFGEVAEGMTYAATPYSHPIIDKATRYIFRNPNIRISQVADYCNMSESGIYALFKKHTGKTPNDVRLQALCEKAITQLSTTNRSVQEISDLLGFSSTSYFRKTLRKYTGKTPLEIRKESAF